MHKEEIIILVMIVISSVAYYLGYKRGRQKPLWQYGQISGGRIARKHVENGNVQFILWNRGEQGYKESYWHDQHPSWWPEFIPYGDAKPESNRNA